LPQVVLVYNELRKQHQKDMDCKTNETTHSFDMPRLDLSTFVASAHRLRLHHNIILNNYEAKN
jgi:hypothetical protein